MRIGLQGHASSTLQCWGKEPHMNDQKRMLTTGTRTLRRQLQGFRSRQTHHNTAVRHRLEEYACKSGATSRQCRARIEMSLLEKTTTSDGRENLHDDLPVQPLRVGRWDVRDDRHAFANLSKTPYYSSPWVDDARKTHATCYVGHRTNHRCARQDPAGELRDGDAGKDADE